MNRVIILGLPLLLLILLISGIIKLKLQKIISIKELIITVLLLTSSTLLSWFVEGDRFFYYNVIVLDGLRMDPTFYRSSVSLFSYTIAFSCILYLFYKAMNFENKIHDQNNDRVTDFVEKVFNNERFHTAFSVTLPRGEDDVNNGIDYIPFILQNLENKRTRFKKTSDRFLLITMVLGGLFVIIITGFGYVLLESNSIGISKTMLDIKIAVTRANLNLTILEDKDINNTLINKYSLNLDEIKTSLLDKSTYPKQGAHSLVQAIIDFKKDKNLDLLLTKTRISMDSINDSGENSAISKLVNNTYKQLEQYSNSISYANANYNLAVKNMIELLPKVEQEIEKPQNQLTEIIKRLILSVVISSFFFAILRYSSKLYQENYTLMIKAEDEDLAVRKFYVGLKNTSKNDDDRKIVIESLLEKVKNDQDRSSSGIGLSKEESGILKDMLNNLMKKI